METLTTKFTDYSDIKMEEGSIKVLEELNESIFSAAGSIHALLHKYEGTDKNINLINILNGIKNLENLIEIELNKTK